MSDAVSKSVGPGSRLGPYEITAKLGEGGMGEVWRARDSQLGRDVALKVLPGQFTQDPERLARFEREAKLLAQLNHPNIAHIYGFEASGEARALVMELVEGPTLAERLDPGPLPFNESLSISLQIAQALEEAHEKGIVHRDLKPQNVKASIEGKVKVLDFGLAKAMDPTSAVSGSGTSASQLAQSPTLTLGATQMGVILGTAAYMAPEQAKGMAVDKRADIWAFGVVLFEMLTGKRLFAGDSVPETLAGVLKTEIDFSALPESTPRRVRDLLRRCLERNPKNRLHDIADARIEIEEALARPESAAGGTSSGVMAPTGPLAKRGHSPWMLVAAALAAALVGLLVVRPPWSGGSGDGPRARLKTSRLTWGLPEGISPVPLEESSPLVAVSPDGTTLAAAVINERGEQLLYVRPLDSLESRLLPGTEGASEPIFSPDGRSIAFFAGGELKRTATSGGAVVKIANAPDSRGGAWAPDGTLVYTPVTNAGLMRVAESGGTPQALTTPDPSRGERTHRWPDVLPEGKAALFTVGTNDSPDFYDEARIEAVVLATGERRPVLEGASLARYLAATGELVFGRGGALYAVAFDAERLAVEGKPRLVLDGVGSDVTSGAVHMALSPDGTLAYLAAEATAAENRLAWLSPDGTVEPLAAPARAYWSSNVSPDGRRIATLLSSRGVGEIWIVDVGQGTLSRLSADDSCFDPIWTPDGRFVVYSRKLDNGTEIVRQAADGGVAERLALTSNPSAIARSISRDGTTLFFESHSGKNASDIYSLALDARGEVETVVSSTADQYFPVISPDGRWLAFVSQESGRGEVYVRSYPEPGAQRQVSSRGGSEPQWAREGHTLFFRTPSGLARVELGAGPRGEPGAPEPLEKIRMLTRHSNWSYNLAPDGRFLIQMPSSRAQRPEIVVVPDWAAELRRSLTAARR